MKDKELPDYDESDREALIQKVEELEKQNKELRSQNSKGVHVGVRISLNSWAKYLGGVSEKHGSVRLDFLPNEVEEETWRMGPIEVRMRVSSRVGD